MQDIQNTMQKTSLKGVLFISLIAFLAGVFLGPIIKNYVASRTLADTQSVEKVITKSEQFPLLLHVWNILDTDFIEKTPAANDKIYGMIKGLVASYGDPYTEFFDPKETKSFTEEVSGQFEGVGMEVDNKHGLLMVIAPLKDTPSYKAGMKAGDIITKIDDQTTADMTLEEAISKMRGKKGTSVTITVIRKGTAEAFDVTIVRDVIAIPNIEVKKVDGVRVVALYTFTDNSYSEFKNAIADYDPKTEKGLVIDVRGNPGGYLDAAIDIASLFLPSGKIIVSEKSKDDTSLVHRSKGYNTVFQDSQIPVVVLVDGGSASASEILAGALSEQKVATVVGTQTYGKGSVQEFQQLPLDTAIKVTVAQWYTPNGISISKEGLHPDTEVVFDVEAYAKTKKDSQLEKALQIIQSQ